jgi:hypothetical protein
LYLKNKKNSGFAGTLQKQIYNFFLQTQKIIP